MHWEAVEWKGVILKEVLSSWVRSALKRSCDHIHIHSLSLSPSFLPSLPPSLPASPPFYLFLPLSLSLSDYQFGYSKLFHICLYHNAVRTSAGTEPNRTKPKNMSLTFIKLAISRYFTVVIQACLTY